MKLRGFRIEPGEIEAALAGHPAVREAAVVAREERPGEVRLAAWVVPARRRPAGGGGAAATPSAASCRSIWCPPTLRSSTPCRSPRAARWTAGALRARLPAGEPAPAAEPDGDLETEIEELVAGIWQDLLRRGSIGRDDNLFDVGAHSILAIEFTSRVYDALGLEIPLRLPFESPTIRRLSAAIQELADRADRHPHRRRGRAAGRVNGCAADQAPRAWKGSRRWLPCNKPRKRDRRDSS